VFSLSQSRRIRGSAGEPLPVVFQALEDRGTRFQRGQLVLVAAGPGTGKSAFILTLAMKSRLPALYFSADSDAFTQLTRAISIETGRTLEESAIAVLEGKLDGITEVLDEIPIRLNYDASPSIDRIEEVMMAYFEVYEDYPAIVVVDNVTNVDNPSSSGDDPFSGLEPLMDYLSTMARNTQACVIGLHHVTGPYNDADKPIPMSGIKGQIGRVPSMVLTLHKRFDELMDRVILAVSAVKNRGGKADPSGQEFSSLEFIGERMTIRDMPTDPNVVMEGIEVDSFGLEVDIEQDPFDDPFKDDDFSSYPGEENDLF
jgi:hypothetical protein